MSHSAIVGFGMYLPKFRIRTEEIAKHFGQDPRHIKTSLGIEEKTVAGTDEDSFTMAFEAGRQAIEIAGIRPAEISALFAGSESHPYAVKPTSSMLIAALELDPFSFAADLEFACKAGTAALQIVDSFVQSKHIEYGMAIGVDKAQAKPGDALEYTAAAGAAAIILGPERAKNALCRIDQTLSFTTDTPDFWRPQHAKHPEHAGRFTGEPGYFTHVREALKGILKCSHLNSSDIAHLVLHMPNAKFPTRVARELGFEKKQLEQGLIVSRIGNTYSACSLLGLINILQKAKNNEKILLVSYGSGAGSDAFLMTMLQDGSELPQEEREPVHLSYSEYHALIA